jgi:hypothetical protein
LTGEVLASVWIGSAAERERPLAHLDVLLGERLRHWEVARFVVQEF